MKTIGTIGIKSSSRRWLAAVIGVLGIVGGARERAWANDIAFRDVVRNTDFLSAGIGGLRNVGSGTITLRGMTGEVHRAWLYWAGPSNTTNPAANAGIILSGQAVRGEQIGFTSDNCWGFRNSQAYRADVTDIVAAKGNGAYAIAGLLKQGTNINANGASLLVFYNDGIAVNDRDIVLYDGNDSNAPNRYDIPGWNVRLAGIRYTSGTASIQLHVSDGQVYKDSEVIVNGRALIAAGSIFQGTTLPSGNNGPINNGNLWDIKKVDVTPFLIAGSNTLQMTHRYLSSGGDCVSLIVAAINLPAGAAPVFTNTAPSILADAEMTIHTPNPVALNADLTDLDGDPLTTAISLDGVLVYTGTIEKGSTITSGSLRLTRSHAPGDHTILFAVSDGELSASCVMALRVVDNTPPTMTVPANITVPTDPGRPTAAVRFTATAADDFPGEATVVCLPLPSSAFPIGVTTVNCSATDRTGNTARGSFTITVTDALPPTITCPADLIRPAARGTNATAVTFVVPFSDNQPGATLICVPPSGSVFLMGMNPVACLARDAAGNTAACSFNVILIDAQPPVVICPTNTIAGNDHGQCSAVVNYSVRVNDNVAGATLRCVPPPGTAFPLGTSIVNCVAGDAAGNIASNSFQVIISDTEKPMLALPIDIVAPRTRSKATAVVNYSVRATDNCSTPVVCCAPKSGSVFPAGATIVRCTAADAAGNMTAGSFKVIVRDTEPPVIKYIKVTKKSLPAPSRSRTHAIQVKTYAITVKVAATDNFGPITSRIVSITSSTTGSTPADRQITGPLTANLKAGRVYIINVEARDAAGNVANGTTTLKLSGSSSHGEPDDDDCDGGTRPHTSSHGVPTGSH